MCPLQAPRKCVRVMSIELCDDECDDGLGKAIKARKMRLVYMINVNKFICAETEPLVSRW